MEKPYHIQLDNRLGARYAILPGDPGRVEAIAALLDEPEFVACNREFTTWCGMLCNQPVLVTSTGIGGPSAAIAMEELAQVGVHTFLRCGTCGAMQLEVLGGDLVIATGAVRMEGTSREYLPIEVPAVANYEVVCELEDTARMLQKRYHVGLVQSKDSFYGQHNPGRMPVADELLQKWEAYRRCGVLASEMECAALFSVAQALHVRCGAVLSVLWNQEREKAGLDNPHVLDTSAAAEVAVAVIERLIRQKA